MTVVRVEDIIGPCIISTLSAYQMGVFARKVGKARIKYKVNAPSTMGDETFNRIFRAQQNCCEFYPMFLASLWSSSLLLHQGPPTALGLVYMVGRAKYFRAYSENADKRYSGFKLSANALKGMGLCACVGIAHLLFVKITGNTAISYLKH